MAGCSHALAPGEKFLGRLKEDLECARHIHVGNPLKGAKTEDDVGIVPARMHIALVKGPEALPGRNVLGSS